MALEEAVRRCYPVLVIEDNRKREIVEHVVRPFVLDPDAVIKVRDTFRREMELGLLLNPERPSSLQMDVAYIPGLPDGTEKGGRVGSGLGRDKLPSTAPSSDARKSSSVPSAALHRVECSVDAAVLTEWVVSYDCSGVVGEDVGRMLREAIRRRTNIDVDLVAIVNDTIGTLVQGAFMDSGCAIGLIMGTGSNGCYLEKTEEVQKLQAEPERLKDAPSEVIVNVEWGAFGDNGVVDFVKTELDRRVDGQSLYPGAFTFEKLVSGEFLGDIARQILVELVSRQVLFAGDETAVQRLTKRGTFTAVDISRFLGQNDTHARDIAARFVGSAEQITNDDITLLRYVCGVISTRAAVLVSLCLAELLERVDKPTPVTIAVDGSLYKYHPTLREHMDALITAMAPGRPFKLMLAENGSGKGAGLVAAVVERLRSTNTNGCH
ncbi:hypothetical protein MTO96_003842 [Rhipicephalus appendiculatus]